MRKIIYIEFKLKNIDETRNYYIEEINQQNTLMSKKHKSVCTALNCNEQELILASTITGWISISAFSSLLDIFIGISSSVLGFKIYAITAGV